MRNFKTQRDYFIAHAPAEPRSWFKPVLPPEPTHPGPRPKIIGVQSTPETIAWGMALQKYEHLMALYAKEVKKQTYIQWPIAWADALIDAVNARCEGKESE